MQQDALVSGDRSEGVFIIPGVGSVYGWLVVVL